MTLVHATARIKAKPDLSKLSTELQAVIRSRGPTPIGDVSGVYQAMHGGKHFNLHGLTLRACLKGGNLRGVRLNPHNNMLELAGTPEKPASGPGAAATVSAGGARQSLAGPKPSKGREQSSNATDQSLPPKAASSSYVLISDGTTWAAALLTIFGCHGSGGDNKRLQQFCTGLSISLRVDGEKLGTKAGVISLIEIAWRWNDCFPITTLIFDVVTLEKTKIGRDILREQLCPFLGDDKTIKVVFDFANSAIALRFHFGPELKLSCILDAQLAYEVVHGGVRGDIVSVLKAFQGKSIPYSVAARRAHSHVNAASTRRPLVGTVLDSVAQAAISLIEAIGGIASSLSQRQKWHSVLRASQLKTDFVMTSMLHDTRRVTFRTQGSCWGGGTGRILMSHELKQVQKETASASGKTGGTVACKEKPQVSKAVTPSGAFTSLLSRMTISSAETNAVEDPNSPREVLRLVPEIFLREHLSERDTQNLKDVQELVIDEGRRPKAHFQGRGRIFLCSDESVVATKEHIDKIVGRLELEGRFGEDNRAGFAGQLHRISVMRRKHKGRIFGVTLRIGRFFKGSAAFIDDILFHVAKSADTPKRAASILILGEAGSGKTTVIRDICRKISTTQTVVIVDTSNEIAGDGDVPHREAIGESRRIMVPNKADQHSVMKEALQNHTPQTIVVDEISSNLEARACLDIKARGVRVVASAHGDLQSLLKNPNLNTLVGGMQNVTIGDDMARQSNGGSKIQTTRQASPVFDMVIELQRGEINTWTIIKNTGLAVDALLKGESYEVEQRTRITDDTHGEKGSEPDDVSFLLKFDKEEEKSHQYY